MSAIAVEHVPEEFGQDDGPFPSDAAYAEYCRCWRVFLDLINVNPGFTRVLTEHAARAGSTVTQWPTVWVHVAIVFGRANDGKVRNRFVAAVHDACSVRRRGDR